MSVIPQGAFGERVAARLREERVVWFTTVGADGTPQPNPVWFLWDGEASVLIYNHHAAHRLRHVEQRPNVSLHFGSDSGGNDVVVLVGTARRDDRVPPPHEHPDYVAKYGAAMARVSGTPEQFAADYSVPLRIDIRRVRGF